MAKGKIVGNTSERIDEAGTQSNEEASRKCKCSNLLNSRLSSKKKLLRASIRDFRRSHDPLRPLPRRTPRHQPFLQPLQPQERDDKEGAPQTSALPGGSVLRTSFEDIRRS